MTRPATHVAINVERDPQDLRHYGCPQYCKAVAHARLGDEVLGLRWDGLELAADLSKVDEY